MDSKQLRLVHAIVYELESLYMEDWLELGSLTNGGDLVRDHFRIDIGLMY